MDTPAEEVAAGEEAASQKAPEVQTVDIDTENVQPQQPEAEMPFSDVPETEAGGEGTADAGTEESAGQEVQEPAGYDADVQRGQTYAAQEQYANDQPPYGGQPYGGQDYGYGPQEGAQQQYGGQGYGYEPSQEDYDGEPEYEEDYSDEMAEQSPASFEQIRRKSRKMVKSPLFFLMALVYTVSVVASVLNVVTGSARENIRTVANTITNYLGQSTVISLMNQGVEKLMQQDDLVLLGTGILMTLPAIFIMLGLWMAFFSTSARRQHVSTGGYTLVRVIEIIRFIAACLVLLAGIALSVSFVVAAGTEMSSGSGNSMVTMIVAIIVLLVIVIAAVFTIMYYVQLLFTIKTVRTNVRDGEYIGKIPGFVIFIGILLCLATAAGMIPMAPDDYIGLAARGSKAAWLLLASIWALVYRGVVKEK